MNQFKSLIFRFSCFLWPRVHGRHAVEYVPFKKAATDRYLGFIMADGTIKMEAVADLLLRQS